MHVQPTHVDLQFPLHGQSLPVDHGYALYGALSRAAPHLHDAGWLAVHPIAAKLAAPDLLSLRPHGALRLRVPVSHIASLLVLAGQQLDIAGHSVTVGTPSIHVLKPAEVLDASLVIIKLTGGVKAPGVPIDLERFRARFLAEAQRQLQQHGVDGSLEIRGRRSLRVGGRRVMGCAVRVSGLTPEHSMLLQVLGIGGKRTMGCGIFRPSRPRG
jgi:CRISPR-associated protein Cas6